MFYWRVATMSEIDVTDELVSEPVAMLLHWRVVTLSVSGCVDDHADQTIPHLQVTVPVAMMSYWQLAELVIR